MGFGLDEAGIADDRDMLQEMWLLLRAHRIPGMDDDVPRIDQVFKMATVGAVLERANAASYPRLCCPT